MVPQWAKQAQQASINLALKSHAILFGSGRQTGSNKTRLHKAQLISHLETSPITNIKPLSSKKQFLIPTTHPPVLKLEDQLKLRIASTSQVLPVYPQQDNG